MYKNHLHHRNRSIKLFSKDSLRVKIIALVFLAMFFKAQATTYGQKITVKLRNASLTEVLASIQKQTGYDFLYNSSLGKDLPKKNIDVNNMELKEALAMLLTPYQLDFEIDQKIVVIKKRKAIAKTTTVSSLLAEENLRTEAVQQRVIKGKVTNETGEPIQGATVAVKGSTVSTSSDENGNYSLNINNSHTAITVSAVGYALAEVAIGSQNTINITLQSLISDLDEVVVVGYGTQKKATVTGSVATIGTEELAKAPVSNLSNALVGRMPGIRVQNTGGVPGSESTVDIRGFGQPLILVDGIEQPGFQIDPNEVESISVLKDAAASIYGVKAGNGVLLITTKKGNAGAAKITYNGSVALQNFTSFPKMVNAAQYAELVDEDAINRGNAPIYGPEKLQLFKEGLDGYKSYDWFDILTRDFAPQTQHNVNISGGTETSRYFTSVGYTKQEGMYTTKDMDFGRYNFRSNLSSTIAENLTADVQVSGRVENRQAPYDDDTFIIHGVTRMLPTMSPYANDNDPSYYGLTNFQNPLARSDADYSGYRRGKKKLLNAQFSLKYDIPAVKGLSTKVLFSYLTKVEEDKNFAKEFFLYEHDSQNNTYNQVFKGNSPSSLNRRNYTSEQNLLQFSLNYNRRFADKHNVSALALFERREDKDDFVQAYRQFDIDALEQINAGSDINKNNSGNESEMANVSFVGRVNYDYMQKYLVELAFREDGSAKFHKDNRWGFFPSASLGWRLSEESFIRDNTTIFDDLKLRLSYGKMGDDRGKDNEVKAFQYLTGYNYPGGSSYIFGSDVIQSLNPKGLPNIAYTWFTSEIFNLGLDASFWNRKLEVTFDAFYRKRKGLLAYRTLSLPNTFGVSLPQENLNSDDYRGFELSLGHRNQINDFQYAIKGNVSFTRIKDVYIEQADPINSLTNWKNNRSDRWQNITYGYKYVGQFQNQEQINNWAIQDGAGNTTLTPGDLMFQDLNGDGVIDGNDTQPIGRNDKPEVYFGLDLSASWKNFDLSVLMQGATNYSRYLDGSMGYALFNGSSALEMFTDRWRRADLYDPNSEWIPGKYPSTYSSGKESNTRRSNFNLKDSYYLRVKNIELGYTIPTHITKDKIGIHSLRVYLSGNNLFTFDNLPYGDPEAPSNDRILYPQMRVYNFGVNLTF